MDKEYKVVNGTYFKESTPEAVTEILDRALQSKKRFPNGRARIRVFYGDKTTGRDWLEEHDTIGYIGRSTGSIKIPLLILRSNSTGGGALLDDCIVKITQDKETIYAHKTYHIGELTVGQNTGKNLTDKGLLFSVERDGENHANFETETQAQNYILFLKGLRNRL